MNILDRYLLRELFKPFLVCLASFLLCMVVLDLFDNIHDFIQAQISLWTLLRYYLVLIPAWLVFVMPITLLLSLLQALTTMSKHGEITALRACGMDMYRLMTPYLLVGICVSIQILSLNIAWAPNALYRAKVIFEKNTHKDQESKQESVGVTYYNHAANRFWVVSILNPSQGWARGLDITIANESMKDLKRIRAESGKYTRGRWIFENVTIYDFTLPVEDPKVASKLDLYVADEFTESPKEFIVEYKKTKRMTTRELLRALEYTARLSPKKHAMFSTEFHYRIAFPLSNFVIFLIGIPLGIVGQRKNPLLAVVYALSLFAVYYLLVQMFFMLGQSGRITPWIAGWLPHLLFTFAGIGLIRRIR